MTNNSKPEPLAVSPRQAMELVPIRTTRLYEAIRSGEIKSKLVGSKRLIDFQSLKDFAGVE